MREIYIYLFLRWFPQEVDYERIVLKSYQGFHKAVSPDESAGMVSLPDEIVYRLCQFLHFLLVSCINIELRRVWSVIFHNHLV